MALDADVPQLVKEAGNFERISGELQSVLGQVDSTGGALAAAMASEGAGNAAQQALMRFQEAAGQQISLLQDISNNIHVSGTDYTGTDVQGADDIAHAAANMGLS